MNKNNLRQDYSREERIFLLLGLLIIGSTALSVFYPLLSLVILFGATLWTIFNRHFKSLIIFLPAYLPFQIALNPAADIDLASGRVFIVLLTLIFCIKVIFKEKGWFRLSNLSLAVIFFLLWSSLSIFSAEDSGRFARKILVFLSIFPLFFLTGTILKKISDWEKLFKYWVYSSFLVAILGFGQFCLQFLIGQEFFFKFWSKIVAPILYGANAGESVASNPSWFVGIGGIDFLRAIGTFPDPHMLAFYLGMSLPLQAVFIFLNGKKFLWPLGLISFLTLILTFSRGSYVGLAGIFIWLLFFILKAKADRHFALRIKALGNQFKLSRLFALVIIFAVLVSSIAPFRDRFLSIFDFDEGSNQGRLELWSEAVDTVIYNPVLGVGLGNFSNFIRPESKYREPIYAHNTYLDLATEIGLPGLLAWLLILFIAMKPILPSQFDRVMPLLFATKKLSGQQALPLWNLAVGLALLWFALHCLFETPIFSPQILPLFVLLIAFRGHSEARKNRPNLQVGK